MKTRSLFCFALVGLLSSHLAQAEDSFRIRGRLMTRVEARDQDPASDLRDEPRDWGHAWLLEHARLDARFEPSKRLRLELELDFAGLFAVQGIEENGLVVGNLLKDAYVRYKLAKGFYATVGHFKKPFSRMQLTSPFELRVGARGLIDRTFVKNGYAGGFGGRDVGGMLSFRQKDLLGLKVELGAFSPPAAWDNHAQGHHDWVARVELAPLKLLEVAADACFKSYTDSQGATQDSYALGLDAKLELRGATLTLEGLYGERFAGIRFQDGVSPVVLGAGGRFVGAHAGLDYTLALSAKNKLVPAIQVEWLDPDHRQDGNLVRLAGGLTWILSKRLSVMAYAEHTFDGGRITVPTQYEERALLASDTRVGLQFSVSVEEEWQKPQADFKAP